ncbi:17.6 kDa class II heat shock protein [Gossypium australe]|uniref:17.6 kDa class II heat shock protein n=1 Tax=Gossypium australe TaxID=47621 RepID=A0A5B6U9P4_9ROSI|nr:17.6 kDa class II heat shock protein [Gossypium australe]
MRIHPLPKKRNITIQYEMNPRTTRSQAETLLTGGSNKKLRRLPHIFSRVLELPFRSDADVAVEESPDCFKFVAETDGRIGDVVRAHTVEIHPGVTKIVIRSNSLVGFGLLDDLELDMWRFRLPETTRPELASAVYEDGELIVTVPKGGEVENLEDGGGGDELRGGMGNGNNNNNNNNRLVLVQGENLYELVEIRQMGKLGKASLRCKPCGSGVASLIGFLWVAAFIAKELNIFKV